MTNNTSAFADFFLTPLAADLNRVTLEHGNTPDGHREASRVRAQHSLRLEREIERGGDDE